MNYIEKQKGEENAFSQYGTFVHSLLEQHAKGELGAWELLDAYTDEYSDKVTLQFPYNRYVDLSESYFKDGYEFLKNFDGLDDLDIIGVETRFRETLDDFIYTGIIDIIYIDKDGGIVVRDWKSKSKFANKKELARYAKQPLSYSLHIKNKYNKSPKSVQFFMFRKQNIVDIPFRESEYDDALNWARATVSDIRNCKDWPASQDDFFCENLCGFRNMCPYKRG